MKIHNPDILPSGTSGYYLRNLGGAVEWAQVTGGAGSGYSGYSGYSGAFNQSNVDDFTIKIEDNKLKVADRIEQNIMLNAFRIAVNGSLSLQKMVDGIIDEYEDETGVDTANSENEVYDGTNDLYYPDDLFGGKDSDTKLVISGDFGDESYFAHNVDYGNETSIVPSGKFGEGAVYFDGSNEYLTIADSDNWDICASDSDSWTIDLWVKHEDHAGSETYISQYEDANNYWVFRHDDGDGLRFILWTGGAYGINLDADGEITDTNWHHIALVKVADEYGVYKDGTQVGYVQDSSTDTFSADLSIARRGSAGDYFAGNMDAIRIDNSNVFSASPNSGKTDTITIPTAAPESTTTTKLLLNFEGGDEYGDHNIEPRFDAVVKRNKFSQCLYISGGATDYVLVPDSSDWTLGTDDFTVDFWINFAADATVDVWHLEDGSDYFNMSYDSTNNRWSLVSWHTTYDIEVDTGTNSWYPDIGAWHHIAFVRDGTTSNDWYIFIDGKSQSLTKRNGDWDCSLHNYSSSLYIGHTSSSWKGYIDEFRVSSSARWTSDFSLPSEPFSSDGSTNLLLHFDSFSACKGIEDVSGREHVITQSGDAVLSAAQKKFGTGSCYFDGTGDYLTAPDSADFDVCASASDNWTVDFWVRMTDHSGTENFIAHGANSSNSWFIYHVDGTGLIFKCTDSGPAVIETGSGGEITDSDWHHIALCKVADEYGVYKDGTQVGYVQDSSIADQTGSLYIGVDASASNPFDGYIDEVRIQHSNAFSASPNSGKTDTITTPTSVHTADSDTKLLLHMDGYDVSNSHITNFNNDAYVEDFGKFGDGAWSLDGTNDYLRVPASADFQWTGDFTLDMWIKRNGNGQDTEENIFAWSSGSGYIAQIFYSRTGNFLQYYSNTTGKYTRWSINLNDNKKWNHLAFVRSGNTNYWFWNGVEQTKVHDDIGVGETIGSSTGFVLIGALSPSYYRSWNGQFDEVRVSKGVARWTSDFTPPTGEYTEEGKDDMVLISSSNTAEAAPDDARIVIFEEDVDAVTVNTHLKAYVSRDGGTTYTQVTLSDEGDYETDKRILSGTVDISGQPSGTTMKYKIETFGKNLKIHGTGMLWD